MEYIIEYSDIFNQSADALVVPVSKKPVIGSDNSLEGQVYKMAGKEQLMDARIKASKKGDGVIEYGTAIVTDAFGLENYKKIIMVVTPINTANNKYELLASPASREIKKLNTCCEAIMKIINCNVDIKTVCMPLLGTGVNCIPRDLALSTINAFFNEEKYANRRRKTIILCLKYGGVEEEIKDGIDLSKRLYMFISQNSSEEEICEYFYNEYNSLGILDETTFQEYEKNVDILKEFKRDKKLEDKDKNKDRFYNALTVSLNPKEISKEPYVILRDILEKNNVKQSYLCEALKVDKKQMSEWINGIHAPTDTRNTYLVMAYLAKANQEDMEKLARACNTIFPSSARDGLLLWHLRKDWNDINFHDKKESDCEISKKVRELNEDFMNYLNKPFYPIDENEVKKTKRKSADKEKEN